MKEEISKIDTFGYTSSGSVGINIVPTLNNVPAGYWAISDMFKIVVYHKRPNWFHRLMVRWLLGWGWEDA